MPSLVVGRIRISRATNAIANLLLAFLISGGYLLVWPIYRVLHRRKTQRRQALLKLFLIEVALDGFLTGYVVFGFFRIPDFHHGLFLFEITDSVLAVFCWVATYGVWADSDLKIEA